MAAFLADTFTGATALINGRVPATGGAWVAAAGSSLNLAMTGVANGGGPYITSTGLMSQNGSTPFLVGYSSTTPPSPDYTAVFAVRMDAAGANDSQGVTLRGNYSTGHGYHVRVTRSRVYIVKSVAGVTTEVATTASNASLYGVPTTGVEVSYTALIKGATITVSRNGTPVLSWTDSGTTDGAVITDAGKIGLCPQGGNANFVMRSLSVEDAAATITPGDMGASGSATASMAASAFVSSSFSAAGLTTVANIISSQYHVGSGSVAGLSIASFSGLILSSGQMYALCQPPEPAFVSVPFNDGSGAIGGAGTASASFIGRAAASGAGSTTGVASSSVIGRAFQPGEAEFSGASGVSVGSFIGVKVVSAAMVSAPTYNTFSFDIISRSIFTAVFTSAGSSVSDISGYAPVTISCVGTSTASFEPIDVVIPAILSGHGRDDANFAPPVIHSGAMRANSVITAQMPGFVFNAAKLSAAGTSSFAKWAGASVQPSVMTGGGSSSGLALSLSFSVNIATPVERTALLLAEERSVILDAEDREVILPQEEREVLLPAETRIIYL